MPDDVCCPEHGALLSQISVPLGNDDYDVAFRCPVDKRIWSIDDLELPTPDEDA